MEEPHTHSQHAHAPTRRPESFHQVRLASTSTGFLLPDFPKPVHFLWFRHEVDRNSKHVGRPSMRVATEMTRHLDVVREWWLLPLCALACSSFITLTFRPLRGCVVCRCAVYSVRCCVIASDFAKWRNNRCKTIYDFCTLTRLPDDSH